MKRSLTLILLLTALPLFRARAQAADQVVCAVLADPDSAIQPELVEAELTQLPVTLVDRSAIASLLQERQLDRLLSPDAVADRAQTGRLLKADLLVIMHRMPPRATGAEVVVCETNQGLRLSHAISANPQDVKKFVGDALEIWRNHISEIAAVPPFVDRDLTFKYAPLSGAFRELVEQSLNQRRGILVVELQEAQAIANEIAVAGATNISRPLPLFFAGDFRINLDANGQNAPVRFVIELHRGQMLLDRTEANEIPVAQSSLAIAHSVDRLLRRVSGNAAPPPPDPAAEAAALNARMEVFRSLGNWKEALDLVEASLLVQPQQPRDHGIAVELIGRRLCNPGLGDPDAHQYKINPEAALAAYDDALSHLEAFLRAPREPAGMENGKLTLWRLKGDPNSPIRYDWTVVTALTSFFHPNFADKEYVTGFRTTAFHVLEAKQAQHAHDDIGMLLANEVGLQQGTRKETLVRQLDFVRRYPDTFESAQVLTMFFCLDSKPGSPDMTGSPELRWAIDQLAAMPSPMCQQAATLMHNRLAHGFVPYDDSPSFVFSGLPERPSVPPLASTTHPGLTFKPIDLSLEVSTTQRSRTHPLTAFEKGHFVGWCPIGPNLDAIWSSDNLYFMSHKGQLKRVCRIASASVCFDGKYIWTASPRIYNHTQGPADLMLNVIDPVKGMMTTIGLTDGLLPVDPNQLFESTPAISFAPLEPGHVCMAAYFGRTWVAEIKFNPGGRGPIRVIFEARQQVDDTFRDWQQTDAVFHPTFLAAIYSKPGDSLAHASPKLLVGRFQSPYSPLNEHPLLIDYRTGAAIAVKDDVEMPPENAGMFAENGSIYWTQYEPYPPGWYPQEAMPPKKIFRFGFPELTPIEIANVPVCGPIADINGRFLISNVFHQKDYRVYTTNKAPPGLGQGVDDDWALGDTLTGPYRLLTGELPQAYRPGMFKLCHSQFYGLVLINSVADAAYAVHVPQAESSK